MVTKRRPAPPPEEPRPPWWRERKRGSAKAPLSRDAIVDAAVRVLDAEGADALTIRRLSQELETGPATLYWHITGKEELAELVYDRIIGEIVLPEPDPERWEEQIKDLTRQGYRVMLGHNDAVKLSLGRAPVGPNMLTMIEWMLDLFERAGLPAGIGSYFGDLIGRYIDASVLEVTGAPSFGGDDEDGPDLGDMIRQYYGSLDPARFPHVVSMADQVHRLDDDDRFEMGLDILVRGLKSYIAAASD